MNLHDWIDELMDVLDIELEMDEALVLDVAREAAHQVERPAAPISTFLLGYAAGAAGAAGGETEDIERLAARIIALADKWEVAESDSADDDVDLGDTAMADAEPGA